MTVPDLSNPESLAQARAEAMRLLEGTTPGEWRYRPLRFDDWGMVRAGNDHIVALARDGGVMDEESKSAHRTNGTDPYEANARLITASPTTTATLIAALDALAAARQALAEAEAERERLQEALEIIEAGVRDAKRVGMENHWTFTMGKVASAALAPGREA